MSRHLIDLIAVIATTTVRRKIISFWEIAVVDKLVDPTRVVAHVSLKKAMAELTAQISSLPPLFFRFP